LEALRRLKTAVVDQAFDAYPNRARQAWKKRFVTPAYFADRFESSALPTTFFFVGSRSDPEGMIALKERAGVAYIGDFYVRDQGRGIGRDLLHYVLQQARVRGLQTAVADVFEGAQASASLFQAEGFAEREDYLEPSLRIKVHRLALDLK
jgi:L-amino acid N-acyltransferase YncA